MLEAARAVEDLVLSLAGSPWLLLVVVVLVTVDGFFPPVPSESVVIAVAALTAAEGGPPLAPLVLAAAVGAFCGDLVAYTIGRLVPVERLRVMQGRRARRASGRARYILATRGTVLILSARFVPIGRVAVNMSAGAVDFPRRRFVLIAAIAALVWAGYTTALGVGAGVFLQDHPLAAVATGVVGGVVLGLVVDRLLTWVHARLLPGLPTTGEMLEGEGPAPD